MSGDDDIADVLAREVERIEREDDEEEKEGRQYFRLRPATDPSQVYSVRIPVDRLEELRVVAEGKGVAPSALLREWVLERLDTERSIACADPRFSRVIEELRQTLDEALSKAVRSAMERATEPSGSRRTARKSAPESGV